MEDLNLSPFPLDLASLLGHHSQWNYWLHIEVGGDHHPSVGHQQRGVLSISQGHIDRLEVLDLVRGDQWTERMGCA